MGMMYNFKNFSLKFNKSYVSHKEISKIYDKLSKTHSSSLSSGFLENFKNIFPYTNFEKDSKVLEIGCGDGTLTNLIPDHCHYLGIDISSKMIDEALKKNKKNRKNIFFEKVDAWEFIKYSTENSYDLIIFSFSFKYFDPVFFEKIFKLLKKNGQLIIINEFKENQTTLNALFDSFKKGNHSSLQKINPYQYSPVDPEDFFNVLEKIGFAQTMFFKFDKIMNNPYEYLEHSGIIPELTSEFGNSRELYQEKFFEYLKTNNYQLPIQKFFICLAKK